jgi:exonuclease SbcC
MRINKVSLTNFCQHAQREDEFGPGIIGIIGPNGSGKSNYVKSILRGITGASGNPGRKEEDVTWGQDKGLVEVEFTVNEHTGVVRRQLASSSCSLKYGDKVVRTAKEVDQLMEGLIGVSKSVLTDMVFVQQGAIEGILFQRPADRAKALQNLFGTASAETLRTLLLDEINNTHVESRAEPIARLERMLSETQAHIDYIDGCLSAVQPDSLERMETLRTAISHFRARVQAEMNLQVINTQLVANQDELLTIQKQFQADQRYHDSLKENLELVRSDYEISQKRIQSQQAIKLQMEEQTRLLKEKEAIVAQLAQVAPVLTVDLDRLKKLAGYCEELRASIAVSKKVVSNKEGECPTCRQPITPQHISRHQASLSSEEPQLGMYEKDLREQKLLHDKYQQEHYRWMAAQNSAKGNLERVEGRLKVLGEINFADIDISADLQLVSSFQASEKLVQTLAVKLSGLESRWHALERQRDQLLEQINRLRSQAGSGEPLPDISKMETDLRQLERERETVSRLQGEKVELIRTLTVDSQQLESYKNEEAATGARREWRALIERVRMVLHRDQLPNIVAQAYLGALNTKLSDYLSIFESPFTAQIKTDISIECQFSGGHIAQAERLSGGQKVMLGIAFRFAIYDLFAQSLGFMVLDEPTVYLDSDHVESVFTLLERVKSYSATAGLQLIVVTHEMRLAGVLDKVINLGLPVAS